MSSLATPLFTFLDEYHARNADTSIVLPDLSERIRAVVALVLQVENSTTQWTLAALKALNKQLHAVKQDILEDGAALAFVFNAIKARGVGFKTAVKAAMKGPVSPLTEGARQALQSFLTINGIHSCVLFGRPFEGDKRLSTCNNLTYLFQYYR